MTGRRTEAGFTLVEVLISLLIILVAFTFAAQVLQETSQMLADTAAEQRDAAMPQVVARIRTDIQSSWTFQVLPGTTSPRLRLMGHPAGVVEYDKVGSSLRRTLLDGAGEVRGRGIAMRGVEEWSCAPVTPDLVAVTIRYRRHALRRSPLPTAPGHRGPRTEVRTETFLVIPRGAGLGDHW
ncbi:MAG TPA: type II secretion system protein [Thermoanaerobaculia bacterium]